MWVCGSDIYGQLGLRSKLGWLVNCLVPTVIPEVRAQQVAAGHHYTIVLSVTGEVLVCGSNTYGQLGLQDSPVERCDMEDRKHRNVLTPIPFLLARHIVAGHNKTAIIL